jgi:outer membrane receptor for ferric coprogen and ferric-rhodotorulic acid
MPIDRAMPMSVSIITAQVLQDAHLTDIGAQRKQSTPTDVVIILCMAN